MRTKVFVITLLVSIALAIFITYYITINLHPLVQQEPQTASPAFAETRSSQTLENCDIDMVRMSNTKLARPLLFADMDCEDGKFVKLKGLLNDYIIQKKQEGVFRDASIFFKESNTTSWFSINPASSFQPGSITKIAIMITFLKDAERDPSILERVLLMTQRAPVPEATLTAAPLALNRTYKIKDLIRSMIVDSDNDATLLLGQNMNAQEFVDLFKDLAIGVPDVNDTNHRMSAKEIARFMRVLYNATYLNPQGSEYALSLLTQTAYKEGLPKYLPKGLTVASKFGERLDEENMQNFHEVGIVYLDGNPYLLSMMTKGPNKENLHSAVADMSSICYKFMTGKSN